MQKRSSIIAGLVLICLGSFFLLIQTFPGLAPSIDLALYWPFLIVLVGAGFLLGALLGTAPLAVPGTIIGGIGLILTYQNYTNNWASWAYIWTLIPGFVGLGLIIMSLLDREQASASRAGFILILISLFLFIFFGGILGGLSILGQWWPILLIIAGVVLILRRRRGPAEKEEPSD